MRLNSARTANVCHPHHTPAACCQVLSGHSADVTCGGFTPDGRTIYTGSMDGSLRLWSPKTGECTATVQNHPFHEQGARASCRTCVVSKQQTFTDATTITSLHLLPPHPHHHK